MMLTINLSAEQCLKQFIHTILCAALLHTISYFLLHNISYCVRVSIIKPQMEAYPAVTLQSDSGVCQTVREVLCVQNVAGKKALSQSS